MRSVTHLHRVSVAMAKGKHPVPFRTRKLSPSAPMVLRGGLRGRVGRRRTSFAEGRYHAGSGPRRFVVLCFAAGPCRPADRIIGCGIADPDAGLGLSGRAFASRPWRTGRGGAAEVRGRVLAGDGSQLAGLAGWPGTRVVRKLVRPVTSQPGPAGSWWISVPGQLPLAGRSAQADRVKRSALSWTARVIFRRQEEHSGRERSWQWRQRAGPRRPIPAQPARPASGLASSPEDGFGSVPWQFRRFPR